jgi:hypothetical protein
MSDIYLSTGLFITSLLHNYVLAVEAPAGQHMITGYDLLIILCASIRLISDFYDQRKSQTYETSPASESSIRMDPIRQPSLGTTGTTVLETIASRKPAVELVALATILRKSWDPHNVHSLWFAWRHIFAGCFVSCALMYTSARARRSQVILSDWVTSLIGLWVAFLS